MVQGDRCRPIVATWLIGDSVRLSLELQFVGDFGRRSAVFTGEWTEDVDFAARCLCDDSVTVTDLLFAAVAALHQRHRLNVLRKISSC